MKSGNSTVDMKWVSFHFVNLLVSVMSTLLCRMNLVFCSFNLLDEVILYELMTSRSYLSIHLPT